MSNSSSCAPRHGTLPDYIQLRNHSFICLQGLLRASWSSEPHIWYNGRTVYHIEFFYKDGSTTTTRYDSLTGEELFQEDWKDICYLLGVRHIEELLPSQDQTSQNS